MNAVEKYLAQKLQERVEEGNMRRLRTSRAPADLFSNDYLGIATENIITKQLQSFPPEKLGTGSTGSRLLSGNTEATEILEKEIAAFHGADAALLFNSGYDANLGLLTSVSNKHTTILYDELCHASIIDGVRLSLAANKFKFRHNNIEVLEQKLEKATEPVIVVVESVYSMDGDIAPLKEIAALTERYGASLVVDEAHTTGVFGEKGEGLVSSMQLEDVVFARIHTFGKALGCHGAAIVGSEMLQQYLFNFARTFIYTTALPPHTISSIQLAYQYLSAPGFSNKALHDLIAYFIEKVNQSGTAAWNNSISPIQAYIAGPDTKAKQLSAALKKAGLQVNAILHPTVPEGMERLRICLHTFNTKEQIDLLFDTIRSVQ